MEKILKDVLFKNTGSTTAILEALINNVINVRVLKEEKYHNDNLSKKYGWSKELIIRVTTLEGGRP